MNDIKSTNYSNCIKIIINFKERRKSYNKYILTIRRKEMKKRGLMFLLVLLLIIVIIFIAFIVADEFNIINLRKNGNTQNLNSENALNINKEENTGNFQNNFGGSNGENTGNNATDESKVDFKTKKTDFTLIDQNGNKVSLASYRGNKVVILYWAVWCPPCKEEIPIINELSKEYNDAIFLTIVSPTLGENSEYKTYQEEITAYIQKNNIEVPVLIDEGKKCLDIYGIERYPTTIFIDEYGDIKEKVGSKAKSGKLTKEEIIKKLEEY